MADIDHYLNSEILSGKPKLNGNRGSLSNGILDGVRNGINAKVPHYEEIEIPVPWGHITGKWWGPRGVQPVLAIHGWQDNSGTFDPLASILVEKGFSIYCIDLPGHGHSSHFPLGLMYYVFWDGIHIVRRIVKYFGWNNITIMGHSLGGAIGFLYSAIYPDEVKKYISIDTASPVIANPKSVIELIGETVDKFLEYEYKTLEYVPCYGYEDMIDIVQDGYKGAVYRPGCEIMAKRGMRPAENEQAYLFNRDPRLKVSIPMAFMTLEQVLEFASRIKCEVLNIKSSEASKNILAKYYDVVLDTIEKQAKKMERFHFIGTHHLHLNDAENIAPCISRFLQN